eukprot:Opistho-2@50448
MASHQELRRRRGTVCPLSIALFTVVAAHVCFDLVMGQCEVRTTPSDDLILTSAAGRSIALQNAASIELDAPVINIRDPQGYKMTLQSLVSMVVESQGNYTALLRQREADLSRLKALEDQVAKLQTTIEGLKKNGTATNEIAVNASLGILSCPADFVAVGSYCVYRTILSGAHYIPAMTVCGNLKASLCSADQMTFICARSRDNPSPTLPTVDLAFPDGEWFWTRDRVIAPWSGKVYNSGLVYRRQQADCTGAYIWAEESAAVYVQELNAIPVVAKARFMCCRGA